MAHANRSTLLARVRGLFLALALLLAPLSLAATPLTARAAGPSCSVNSLGGADYTTIQAAVDDTACATINVAAGSYAEHVTIARDVTISGAGASSTTVDGTQSGSVFAVSSGTVTLQNLTITNGSAAGASPNDIGGGIYNEGASVTVNNSVISNNTASNAGGGIFVRNGSAVVNKSTLSGNRSSVGGAIFVRSGSVEVHNSTLPGNSSASNGGGMFISLSSATVSDSTISSSSAGALGGGIFSGGSTVTLSNSTIFGNGAGSLGGAMYNTGPATISASTISGNSAPNGGGIFNGSGGTLTVSESTIADNSAHSGVGGGVYSVTSAAISNSTISGNTASGDGGGLFIGGVLTLSNSTVAGNSASTGGGISNNGTLTLSNSTFSGNAASLGGAIFHSNSATMTNTILANSVSGGDCFGGAPTDQGGNIADDSSCAFSAASSRNATNAELDPAGLKDNGGPTKTIALRPNSPAIDAAVNCPPPATDQRGIARPQGAACDSGAYELADHTPPQITPSVTGTLGASGWYVSDVTVAWSVADAESPISSQSGCDPQSITSDTAGATFTCSATSLGGTSSQAVTLKRDATAPTISAAATTAPNANGWYKGDVTVAFSCADNLSGVASCPASQTLGGEGVSISSAARSATDLAGNTSAPSNLVTVKIDRTAPSVSVTGVSNGATYPLGSVPAAGCSTGDALSGVATVATLSITGGNADGSGSYTATCAGASDSAGNSGAASVSYTVAYRWSGFFQPVDNLPTVNTVKAGQAIPIKFSLGGNYGLSIFAAGYPKVQAVSCGSGAPTDEIEQTVTAGASSLNYDAASGQYSYTWKTDKAWAGSCRQLIVRLVDGTDHSALFKFR